MSTRAKVWSRRLSHAEEATRRSAVCSTHVRSDQTVVPQEAYISNATHRDLEHLTIADLGEAWFYEVAVYMDEKDIVGLT